jgi:hypothetical protein
MSSLRSIDWRRSGRLFLWAMVAILTLNVGRLVYKTFRPARVRAASTLAYTVLRTEKVFDEVGTLRYTNHYVNAVRSDGSKMWRGTTEDVQQRGIDFANGDHVETSELMGKKSTYPKLYAGPPVPRDPAAGCVTAQEQNPRWTIGGEESIGGYRAVRMVMNVGGARTLTMWYGLDVACALLQQRLEHETGVTDQNLDAVILGEPDAALFQVSASLKEVPPSEFFECSDRKGGTCKALPDETQQRLDNRYHEVHLKAATGSAQ